MRSRYTNISSSDEENPHSSNSSSDYYTSEEGSASTSFSGEERPYNSSDHYTPEEDLNWDEDWDYDDDSGSGDESSSDTHSDNETMEEDSSGELNNVALRQQASSIEDYPNVLANKAKYLLPVFSSLSSISTMYAAQDVMRQILTAIGHETTDIAQTLTDMSSAGIDIFSDGESDETLSQKIIHIVALCMLWGIPTLPIIANSILRWFNVLIVEDLYSTLKGKKLAIACPTLLVYLVFALPTTISDTLINVLLSEKLKDEWPSWAIYSEAMLSLIFLLPINMVGIWKVHERLKLVYEKYTTGVDRKLLSRRVEAMSYELKKLEEGEQVDKVTKWLSLVTNTTIQDMAAFSDGGENNQRPLQPYYQTIMNLSEENLTELAEKVCTKKNLRDGSSWGSATATGISILLALSAGAATMRSPYLFYHQTEDWSTAAAWTLSIISGVTKSAFYVASYENLMWLGMHYNHFFGSAPILFGVGGVLMVISALGFWEVAERSLSLVFQKAAEDPAWWYITLEACIYSGGAAANTNGAASLAVRKMAENPQLDLAAAFKERANQVLKPQLRTASRGDEENPRANSASPVESGSEITSEDDPTSLIGYPPQGSLNSTRSDSNGYHTFSFFRCTESKRGGILAPLGRVVRLATGINF